MSRSFKARLGRVAISGLGCLMLSGCLSTMPDANPEADRPKGFLSGIAEKPAIAGRPPLAKVSFAGGQVVVGGPDGYCLDPKTIQNRPERGFALIASCNILSGGRMGPQVPALMVSVAIGPRGSSEALPDPAEIARTAGTPLLAERRTATLVLAQLGQGGDAMAESRDSRYWRGAFALNGRLVGLALYAPKGSTYAGADGATFLETVKTRIIALSEGPRLTAEEGADIKGLLGGLFKR